VNRRTRVVAGVAVAAALSVSGTARAGNASIDVPSEGDAVSAYALPRAEFLEDNYLFYNLPPIGPKGARGNVPLLLEASVAPHFVFYDGLSRATRPRPKGVTRWERFQLFFGNWFFDPSITMQFKLRMVKNDPDAMNTSSPVRPMSFMPRVNLQAFHLERLAAFGPHALLIVSPRASLGHHSNGQEYCRFDTTPGAHLDGLNCPDIPHPNLADVNFRSGDFSLNYWEAGANAALLFLDGENVENQRVELGVFVAHNPLEWGPGGISQQQLELYGGTQVKLDAAYSWFENTLATDEGMGAMSGALTARVSYEQFLGGRSDVPDKLVSAEVSRTFFWLGGAGGFVRYAYGRDYLNILFVEPAISTFQMGVIFQQRPPFRYRYDETK